MGYLIVTGFNTNSGEDWLKYLEQNDVGQRETKSETDMLKLQIKTLKEENIGLKKKLGIKGEYVYNGHMGTMVWEQF